MSRPACFDRHDRARVEQPRRFVLLQLADQPGLGCEPSRVLDRDQGPALVQEPLQLGYA